MVGTGTLAVNFFFSFFFFVCSFFPLARSSTALAAAHIILSYLHNIAMILFYRWAVDWLALRDWPRAVLRAASRQRVYVGGVSLVAVAIDIILCMRGE